MFNSIAAKEISEFNRVLSLLLLSRLSVIDSLELIVKQTKSDRFREIIHDIIKDIKTGNSMSQAFSKYPDIFSEIYISNLRIAEETGEIAEVLSDFTSYQEKFIQLKSKIKHALRYPLFVIIVSVGVIFFMLFFLIPTFESLFRSVRAELPPLTAFLLNLSEYFINHSMVIGIIAVIVITLFWVLFRNKSFKENILDRMILNIPYVSELYKKNLLARYSLSMSILLRSRVDLVDAIKISKNITSNSLFRNELKGVLKSLVVGESFSGNISKSKFFDMTFAKLLAAGEESAELDKVFKVMSEYYSSEFDNKIDNLTSLLEPVLILVVGVIVGVILVAMYLPMFEIINYLGV